MKPLRHLLFRPFLLPGIAVTLFACHQGRSEEAPVDFAARYNPVRPASYVVHDAPVRRGSLRVKVNGKRWEGQLTYQGEALRELRVLHSDSPVLDSILLKEQETHFSQPRLDGENKDELVDLTRRWVSRNFNEGGRIVIDDVNFDGYDDLLLYDALNSGATDQWYDIWVYDRKKKDYLNWDVARRKGLGLWEIRKKKRALVMGRRDADGEEVVEVYRVLRDTTLEKEHG